MKKTLILAALLHGAASLAGAAEFYTPVSVVSYNSNAYFPIERLFEGPGLGYDENEPHDAFAGATTWVTNAPGGYPSDYIAVAGEPVLIVDLGVETNLAEVSIWGYAATNDNGLKEFKLRFATEAEGETGFGASITYNPAFTAIQAPVPRQSFFFDRLVKARFVEVTCTATFFEPPGTSGGDRVGFGEIAFERFNAPPEPNLLAPTNVLIPPTREGADATVTLRNTGQLPLTISNATLSGPNAAAFAIVSRPTTLTTLQSGELLLRFTPGTLEGDVSATLTIASNDPDAPAVDIPIAASVPPPPVAFFAITEITASSQDNDLWPASNLNQGPGVGFDANWPHDAQLGEGSGFFWVTDACGAACDYLDSFPPPTLIVDLGQNRTLQEINVWGYEDSNANGVQEFQLRFATEAEGTAGFGTSVTYAPTFLMDENNEARRFAFAFAQPVSARYVELTCTDNFFGGAQPGGDRVGLGEIAFPTAGSVSPSAPMLITGVQRNPATGAVTLTFSSEAGKTYTIKRSSTLATWTDLATDVAATGATTTYTDSDILPANLEFFYRVTRP